MRSDALRAGWDAHDEGLRPEHNTFYKARGSSLLPGGGPSSLPAERAHGHHGDRPQQSKGGAER